MSEDIYNENSEDSEDNFDLGEEQGEFAQCDECGVLLEDDEFGICEDCREEYIFDENCDCEDDLDADDLDELNKEDEDENA